MTSTVSIQKTVAISAYFRALDAHKTAKEFLQFAEQEYKDSCNEEKKLRFAADVFKKRANASNQQLVQFVRSKQHAHQAYCRSLIVDNNQTGTLVGFKTIEIETYSEFETEHKRLAHDFATKSSEELLATTALQRAIRNLDRVLMSLTQALDEVQKTESILSDAIIALSVFDL